MSEAFLHYGPPILAVAIFLILWNGLVCARFLAGMRGAHRPKAFICGCAVCSICREPTVRAAEKILADARAAQKEWTS